MFRSGKISFSRTIFEDVFSNFDILFIKYERCILIVRRMRLLIFSKGRFKNFDSGETNRRSTVYKLIKL
jgi:hypothetical protein